MKTYFRLAWRNLWRNKRRTFITLASIFLGVLLCTFISSMQEGSYYQYIRAIVNFYSGYMQVHKKGYWDDKQLNNGFQYTDSIRKIIASEPEVLLQAARLESFALASQEEQSRGVMVLGIEPELERQITHVDERIKAGVYLHAGDDGVLIGKRLSEFLHLSVGDTLVLIGQGYQGTNAAGLFPVRGIIRHPSMDFDKQLVYMDIEASRNFYSAPGMATSAVLMTPEDADLKALGERLQAALGPDKEVMDWETMNALLLEQVNSDRISGYFMKGVLYLVIGFGMLGTIMMMMAERKREFGVMIASGMQKRRLYVVLTMESLMMGVLGTLLGIIISLPIIGWFAVNPIPISGELAAMMDEMGFSPYLHFSYELRVFSDQALIVLLMSIVLSFYSLLHIRRLNVMKALRSK